MYKKRIFQFIFLVVLWGCKKSESSSISPKPLIPPISPTIKTGVNMDTTWFNKKYTNYQLVTHRWYGYGDFNKDGYKDMVFMFAGKGTEEYLFQQNSTDRRVVGVFLNHKTYFQLDTNLVYDYLGGYNGVNVADINNDGYLDIYQMTGMWEGTSKPKPSYYNNNGNGGMDSYVFMNNANKGFTKYTIPIEDNPPVTTSVFADADRDGLIEIYQQSLNYFYEYNGNGFTKNVLNLINTFNGQIYNLRVVTPKYVDNNKHDVYFISSDNFTDDFFIMKVEGNNLVPKIKYTVPHTRSGHTEGTNGEREEMYAIDLDNDGKKEYIIPSQIFETTTTPNIPYLLFVNDQGVDVTADFMDPSINTKLTYEQFNGGLRNITGLIYHTFADIDGDGVKEIFPACGLGYLKDGNSYYYKFLNGKFILRFYHLGWFGNLNTTDKNTNYWIFPDEKNGVNLIIPVEGNLGKSYLRSF